MTRLGLDFDNTLVRYDKIFHELALEKGLIDDSLPIEKKAIRDYLHKRGEDEEFTLLQGEVYGLRILEAEPAEGMLDAIHKLKEKQVDMTLISHKTRTPYKGPAYDLREMAMQWLEKHNITKILNKNGKENNIHFAETKEEKMGHKYKDE